MQQKDIWNARFSARPDLGEGTWIKAHKRYFEEKKNSLVIDLGCGYGDESVYLHDMGYDVIACDFSDVGIAHINSVRPDIKTLCFDMAEEWPLEAGSAGIVLASLSTHYFPLVETSGVYNNIYNTIECGGYFILRVNSIKEYLFNDSGHVVAKLENNYYKLDDGTTKHYFNTCDLKRLLGKFNLLELREGNFIFRGNTKYFIEAIAQKK